MRQSTIEFKTVIEPRYPKPPKGRNTVLMGIIFILNLIFTPFIPLACGFYFARTRNLIFLAVFILSIIFSFEVDVKGQDINLRIRKFF